MSGPDEEEKRQQQQQQEEMQQQQTQNQGRQQPTGDAGFDGGMEQSIRGPVIINK